MNFWKKINLLLTVSNELIIFADKVELSLSRKGYFVCKEYGLGIHDFDWHKKLSQQPPDRLLNSRELSYLADSLSENDVKYLKYLLR